MDLAEQDRITMKELDPNALEDFFPYELPKDMILQVLDFLTSKELAVAARTCKKWKDIIYNSLYYRNLVVSHVMGNAIC